MKKAFILLSVAALAVFASCKKDSDPVKPDPTPVKTDSLVLVSAPTDVIPVTGTESPIEIIFISTKNWTASVNKDAESFVSITPKSGVAAQDCKVKVTVDVNKGDLDREFSVTISGEGLDSLSVSFRQTSPEHFIILEPEVDEELNAYVSAPENNTVVIKLNTNVEYSLTDYSDGSFPFQHAVKSDDKQTVTVTLDANNSYEPRQSYVKLIPEGLTDEEGNPFTYRIYIDQAPAYQGLKYSLSMYDMEFDTWGTNALSVAVAGGKHYVCNGTSLYEINPADGSYTTIDISALPGFTYKVITNDDAGHVIICNRTYYNEEYTDGNFRVAYLGSDGLPVTLIDTPAWMLGGPNGAKVKVVGDVTSNALVVATVEGIQTLQTMSNMFNYWTISGGQVSEAVRVSLDDQCLFTWGMAYWSEYPNNCPTVAPITTNPEDGFIVSGAYEANNTYYTDVNGATLLLFAPDAVQSGNYGYQTLDARFVSNAWYFVNVASTFFPEWGLTPVVSLLSDTEQSAQGGSIHDAAVFNHNATTYFAPDWDYGIAPMSDVRLYDAGSGKVGIVLADLNGRCVECYEIDPSLL